MEFNVKRIADILHRKLYTNRISLLSFAAVAFLILGVSYFFTCLRSFTFEGFMTTTTLSETWVCIAWIVMAGIEPFVELTSKDNAVFELIYPASKQEKFVSELVFAFILLPICLFVLNIICFYVGMSACKIYLSTQGITTVAPHFADIFLPFKAWTFGDVICLIGAVAISFFGALVFKNFRLMKIWIIVGLIGLILSALLGVYVYFYHKATGFWFPYSVTEFGYYIEETDSYAYKTIYSYKGQDLSYVPWIFSKALWYPAVSVFDAGMLLWSWILYKTRKA